MYEYEIQKLAARIVLVPPALKLQGAVWAVCALTACRADQGTCSCDSLDLLCWVLVPKLSFAAPWKYLELQLGLANLISAPEPMAVPASSWIAMGLQ